ncbi:hypothetical protein Clow_01602 [Corynebacterium lowii]|uniref:Uncharacterized protein n=1 Tax=Corynebacterium lowii TaxID=1544413 RepID=A0A0Q0U300_9CORY|nr:hypothetical protein Clow_01602 [Corynebacterium lowii]
MTEHPREDDSGRTDWTLTNKDGTKQESLSQVQSDVDGSPTNLKTIDNSEVDLPQQDRQDWANRTGTREGSNVDNHPFNNGDATFSDPTQGTVVPGYYNRELDKRSFADGEGGYVTEHPNGDGTSDWTHNNTEGQQEAVASLEWKDEGGLDNATMIDDTLVTSPPETGENDQTWYNGTVTQDPYDGMFQDEQGRWHDGAKNHEGADTPAYRLENGNILYGVNAEDGHTDWVTENKDEKVSAVRELEWDDNGDPVVKRQDGYISKKEYESKKGGPFSETDIAGGVYNVGTGASFGAAEKSAYLAKEAGEKVDDLAKAAKYGGRGASGFGVAAGAMMDIEQGGMDPTKAWTTNALGGAAALGVGLFIGPGAPVAATVAATYAAGLLVTKVSQQFWRDPVE